MGVYIADKTYKEILPILAQTGERIDTRNITEIDIVRCEECKYLDECILGSYGVSEQGFCYIGERRTDEL